MALTARASARPSGSRQYSARAITSSISVSPVRFAQTQAAQNRARQSAQTARSSVNSTPTYSRNQVKDQLKVIENSAQSSSLNAKFIAMLLMMIVGVFVAALLLNIKVSALAIEAEKVKVQIDKTKQDTQSIRTQMEQKGSAIAARAVGLGMVQRDKTVTIRLGLNHVVTQEETPSTPQEPQG